METMYTIGEYIPYSLEEAVEGCKELYKLYANKKFYFKKLLGEGYEIQVKVSGELERGNILINKIV